MATVPASLNPSFLAPIAPAPNRTTAFSLPKPFLNLPHSSSSSSSLCRLRRRRLAPTLLASSVKTWSDITSLNHWVGRDYCRLVSSVNALEPQIKRLSDEQLTAKTEKFRRRLSQGETLGDIQAEAFAVVREAARRKLGMRHFDVQIIGGAVLHDGSIAEMKTGEGKTLVSTLAAYLNA